MKIFFITSLIVALVWQTHARSMGPLDEIVKEAGMVKDNLEKIDPKNLEEKVEMVEKDMEGEVKSVATNAKKEIEEEEKMAENFVKNPGKVMKEGEQKLENVEKKAEGELENVAKETEGELESAIKMEQEAAKKAGAMIGSSLKRRSDKKSESGERSSKEHPAADPLKKLTFFLQYFLSNVMSQVAAIGRNISG
ncbi:hypothetical protein P5673_023836 [Acropora cervicornis]|uniref:Uncharacterized protein n=1 Tax=Acropora cervicornis TaxID=6130 RepID=A0AAD9Q4P0_ACRCE|nr:hypothetical protein P5673_023836 [Acropora cervicornis]